MPLVRIDLIQGRTAAQRRSLGEAVHRALVEARASSSGRTLTQKRKLFRRITENLAYLDVRPEDVWINLVETARENWSFGLGQASYAPAEKVTA